MSEFVKKTIVSYKEVAGGLSDPECSHVILTKREYDTLQHNLLMAQNTARDIQYNAKREIQQIQDESEVEIREIEEAAEKRIAEIEKELLEERQESELQRGLNANLIRIAKERANAERKLKPKKEHTGYVVVASTEKEHRYRDGNKRWYSVLLWETILETPYTVDFEVEEVKRLVKELFQKDGDEKWLIQRIGINGDYPNGYAEMIDDKDWVESYQKYNVMVERHMKANYRTGYWEIIFWHTKPLSRVPKNMRAKQ